MGLEVPLWNLPFLGSHFGPHSLLKLSPGGLPPDRILCPEKTWVWLDGAGRLCPALVEKQFWHFFGFLFLPWSDKTLSARVGVWEQGPRRPVILLLMQATWVVLRGLSKSPGCGLHVIHSSQASQVRDPSEGLEIHTQAYSNKNSDTCGI